MSKIELFISIKMDLALNNVQRLICRETQTKKQKNNRMQTSGFIVESFLLNFPVK